MTRDSHIALLCLAVFLLVMIALGSAHSQDHMRWHQQNIDKMGLLCYFCSGTTGRVNAPPSLTTSDFTGARHG